MRLLEQRLDVAARIDSLDDLHATYEMLAAESAGVGTQVSVAVLDNAAMHLKSARAFDVAEDARRDLLASNELHASDRTAVLIKG